MKIEVEIGLEMVIPELQKLPEFEENYDEYYRMYDLMVEVCNLFTEYQSYFVAKFSGEDDAYCIHLKNGCRIDFTGSVSEDSTTDLIFSCLWKMFIPTINSSSLIEKHSIIDNSKNIDYLYEPECELRKEV